MPDETKPDPNRPTDSPSTAQAEVSDSTMSLADSVIDRMKKPKSEEVPIQDGQFIKIQKAEMFKLTCRELAAVVQKNSNHPIAASYRRAISQNPPNEELFIEKIDLEALLDNREIVVTFEEGETEVEGIKMKSKVEMKKLGDPIKADRSAKASTAGDSTPNQPGAVPTRTRHKFGGPQ